MASLAVPRPVRLLDLICWYTCGEENSYYSSHHPDQCGVCEDGGSGAPAKRG